MNIIIIDNYDSFTYNLYQMLQEIMPDKIKVLRNDAVSFDELKQARPDKIVLSPGPGHPAIDEDFGVCKEVILRQTELQCAVLGVCLGHQGIVHHLGGTVVRAPEIVHGKSSEVILFGECALFEGLPRTFQAMRYHSLIAQESDFPAELEVIGREQKRGMIMALKHREKPIYGVQFHPESIGTPQGSTILKNFVAKC
jgi:anthranilate synthase/aminodeoxychorismate synthase-like glutamine amidotransferase